MKRRTKIVATLGPASDDPATLRDMIKAGLDVARLNFSHGNQDEQKARLERLREAAADCDDVVGVIGDLQGPKIRVRRFRKRNVTLKKGDAFFLDPALGEL